MNVFVQWRKFSSQQSIPKGLRLIPNFLDKATENQLYKTSLKLDHELSVQAVSSPKEQSATYLSKQHNIKSDEYYKKVKLQFSDDNYTSTKQPLLCQHFEQYGESGHKLTYFIGNSNIPEFVRNNLIKPLEALDELKELEYKRKNNNSTNKPLEWNFTFNTYRQSKETPTVVPGFPFHTDISSNGEITYIFPLLLSAQLEMKRELPETLLKDHATKIAQDKDVSAGHTGTRIADQRAADDFKTHHKADFFTATLDPGTLLMFNGDSRWNWQHRIVPSPVPKRYSASGNGVATDIDDKDYIYRISLVLGCR